MYFVINSIPDETDPIKLFLMIQEQNYDARAFTLRYDEATKKYENYFFSSEANYEKSFDAYPVDKTGKFITTVYDNHGEVKYNDVNGYRITGVNVSFACPDGYEGKTCQLKPICRDPDDDNAVLPLTDTQFNALGLFRNDTQLSVSNHGTRRRKRKTPLYHNRIYVQCKTKGDYDLVACPPNKLLDFKTMKCVLYDVCEDHLNGYKHNYQLSDSDSPLSNTEYYLCSNNKSKRTKCADDTVFSLVNNGCIQENICYNKGVATIPIDANNYIQCSNDQGTKKNCPNGVVTLDDGTLSCKPKNTCQPQTLTQTTDMLTYDYGKVACTADDEEQLISCGSDLGKRTWKYNWGVDFTIDIDWPNKVLSSDGKCVAPTDAIITNPITKIKWSPLMRDTWDWDVLKECFVCPKGNYVWDYKNNVLRVEKDGKSLSYDEDTEEYKTTDPSVPCHETMGDMPFWWGPLEFIGNPYRFCTVIARLNPIEMYLWPTKTSDGYRADNCQFGDHFLRIYKLISDKPPLGFKESTTNGLLELISGEPIPRPKPNQYIWWSIASGKFDLFQFLEPKALETLDIPSPSTVDITKNQTFSILFTLYSNYKEPINNELCCSRVGIYKYAVPGDSTSDTTLVIQAGYIVFQIINSQLVIDSVDPITLSNNLKLKRIINNE